MATTRALSIEDGNLGKASIATSRNIDYVDIDMSFDLKPTIGDVYKMNGASAVKQAIKNLIMTNRGEKPFSPYFGGNVTKYLFELADTQTARDIEFSITSSIKAFEPRVDPESLNVIALVDPDANSIDITVIFKIINTSLEIVFTTRLNRLR
tara:strand:- start:20951 stop:21406 length:456 start_codon:yes stop_codon:yes gene_type:complete